MANLYAACRTSGTLEVKRVPVTQEVQDKLSTIFITQEHSFLDGILDEVEFTGDWSPDENELMTIDEPTEASVIKNAVAASLISLDPINTANFPSEGIKSLFVAPGDGVSDRILFQSFSAQQYLLRRFTFFLDGNSFKELSEPAFSLNTKLVAILGGSKLKFKSFHNVKMIFDLGGFYREATEEEVDAFLTHANFHIDDPSAFKCESDENIRKLIHAINKSGVLSSCDVDTIQREAAALDLAISLKNGKIAIPRDRKEIKALLRFLDNDIYRAVLGEERYITNSKRRYT